MKHPSGVTVKSKVSNLWITDKLVKRKGSSSIRSLAVLLGTSVHLIFNTIIY